MKNGKKPWGWIAASILFQSSLAWFVLSSFFNALERFDILSQRSSNIFSLIFGGMSFGTITLFYIFCAGRNRKSKVANWCDMNHASIALFNIMLISFFTTIQNEAVWEHEQLKDIVNMQWTIFGLSVTIFLVWHAMVYSYYKRLKPAFLQDTATPPATLISIEKKTLYYRNASMKYSTTTYLGIVFVLLFISTEMVYAFVSPNKSIFFENLLRFSICFSLQTLMKLLVDFLELINAQKKELLEDMAVSSNDIDTYNCTMDRIESISAMLEEINSADNLSPEEKKNAAKTLLKLLADTTSPQQRD